MATSHRPKESAEGKRLMDRRKYERVRVDYPTTFSGKSSRASGTILDLSIGGCRARAPYKLNPDDWHGVLIDVPRYEQPIYIARAVVRWSRKDEFGLEFTHMESEDHQRLFEVVVRSIEGPQNKEH